MKKKPPPHAVNCRCMHCAKHRKYTGGKRPRHPCCQGGHQVAPLCTGCPELPAEVDRARHQLALWPLACLLVFVVVGCATLQVRKACRVECEDKRGPVMTWYGGPTVPSKAWDECMSACESRDGAAPEEDGG